MGADNFRVVGKGKTVADAFRRSTEDARYEDGHGGYTGTIAEKRSCELLDAKVEAARLTVKLEAHRTTLTIAGQKAVKDPWKRIDPARLPEARAEVTKALAGLKLVRKDLLAQRIVHAMEILEGTRFEDSRFQDKWGPALALPYTVDSWLFFGLASS